MKSWVGSKTIWFNVLALLATIVGEVTKVFSLDENTLKIIALVFALGNIILRFNTTEPISTKLPE